MKDVTAEMLQEAANRGPSVPPNNTDPTGSDQSVGAPAECGTTKCATVCPTWGEEGGGGEGGRSIMASAASGGGGSGALLSVCSAQRSWNVPTGF